MEYRQLGASGFKVPALTLGTGTFGGGNEFTSAEKLWAKFEDCTKPVLGERGALRVQAQELVGQHRRAAVVEQHEVKFFRPIGLAWLARVAGFGHGREVARPRPGDGLCAGVRADAQGRR